MKNLPLLTLLIILFFSCKKEKINNNSIEQLTYPEVTTFEITNITENSIKTGAYVKSDDESIIYETGVCWGTTHLPNVLQNKTINNSGYFYFTIDVNELSQFTTYFLRAYAICKNKVVYGNEYTFNTLGHPTPIIETLSPNHISYKDAFCGGKLIYAGGTSITSIGVCWSTDSNPTINNSFTNDFISNMTFRSYISNLNSYTTYYVRAYVTNDYGTQYGENVKFKTGGTVTDIDGNKYNTVFIGNQEWLLENLKVTKYRNGEPIQYITTGQWNIDQIGKYCNYYNNESNGDHYGKLYNWHAVNDSRGIAPEGWHVPTYYDWSELIAYLGGNEVAGGKIKDFESNDWVYPNLGANNQSGFTALPAGYRKSFDGSFNNLGTDTWFWTSSKSFTYDNPYKISLNYNINTISIDSDLSSNGFSIRCIKD